MITIGLTSGLGSIAASIISVSDRCLWICSECGERGNDGEFCAECGHDKAHDDIEYSAQVLWSEVLSGPRKKRGVSHHRRYRSHKLMFEAFFDRWPPAVIALGPPSTNTEPIEWVIFMRTAMFELGKSLNVPVLVYEDDKALVRELGDPTQRAGLKTILRSKLPEFTSNKRRTILSTATAMAGAVKISSLL